MKSAPLTIDDFNAWASQGILASTGLCIQEASKRGVLATFRITPELHQPFGVLNGGVSLLIAESVASFAGVMALDGAGRCLGIEVNASHLESAREGVIEVQAAPIRLGSRVQVWEVRFRREDGAPISIARCTLIVQNTPQS